MQNELNNFANIIVCCKGPWANLVYVVFGTCSSFCSCIDNYFLQVYKLHVLRGGIGTSTLK